MSGDIQPGPTLMPGEPRYEQLAKVFDSGNLQQAPVHPMANLFPMLDKDQRAAFRDSLQDRGQNHPVVFHQGMLLDGRNRARELILLRRPIATVTFTGSNRDAFEFVDDENYRRRHLTVGQRADYAARVATMPLGANQHSRPVAAAQICAPALPLGDVVEAPTALLSQSEAAERYNVSRRSVQDAALYQKQGIPELSQEVQAGNLAVSVAATIATAAAEDQKAILDGLPRDDSGRLTAEAKKEVRKIAKEVRAEDQAVKKEKRREREAALGAKILALPELKAGLILSDFEWHFKVRSEETGMDRHAANHYVTAKDAQTPEAIVERQRARMAIAAEDCIHLMWVPASFSAIAHQVAELQGFKYVSQLVWIKPGIGTGFWIRDRHELLFICVRGKIPCPAMGDQFDSAIEAPKGAHSEKPDFAHEFAERFFPSLPKIEFNARRARPGWIAWGNEAPVASSDDVDNAPQRDAFATLSGVVEASSREARAENSDNGEEAA